MKHKALTGNWILEEDTQVIKVESKKVSLIRSIRKGKVIAALVFILTVGGIIFYNATYTYEDCILDNISGSQNSEAVYAIKSACRRKYSRHY